MKSEYVDGEVLRAAVELLGHRGRSTELGIIEMGGERRTMWGLFDDIDKLVEYAIEAQEDDKANVYLGMNPRPASIPGMTKNGLGLYVRAKASDIEVVTAILTDIDPERAKGAASTDVELAHARTVADKICDWAEEQGFLRPVRCMSGNGVQIWWAIPEWAVHEGFAEKLEVFCGILQKKFSTGAAKIDSTFDLPRIGKAIGTTSFKGEATKDRPHRKTYFLDPPVRREDMELLNFILGLEVPEVPPEPPRDEVVGDVDPSTICQGVRTLLERGHPTGDRSVGIHWLTQSLHAAGASFQATVKAVKEYDRLHGDKLSGRNAEAYIRKSWDKADGKPPCRKLRGAKYCPRRCEKEGDIEEFIIEPGRLNLARDEAVRVISRDPRVYVRGLSLVTITSWDEDNESIRRNAGSPVISPISLAHLGNIITERVRWKKYNARAKEYLPCDVPHDLTSSVYGSPEWPEARLLEGLTMSPIIRANGDVVHTPGYDMRSRLFYVPEGPIPQIGDDPHAAAKALLGVVKNFPFRNETDKAGWLSALLTPIVRALCPCVPMTCIDANCPGTGKSLLTDIIALIVSGGGMARGSYTADDEEMRKRIFAHVIPGDTMVLIDNVPEKASIGWPSLDRALTGEKIVDRVLGKSQNSSHRNLMSWYLTGNNILLDGDVVRRSLHIRLDTPLEHPEKRPPSDFEHPNLKQWVLENRTELLGHCLTIISNFLQRKTPPVDEILLGSFEEWSRIVRGSVLWTTGEDVLDLLASQNDELDGTAQSHIALLEAMARHPRGLTAAEMLRSDDQGLREAVLALVDGDRPTPKMLGYALRAIKGRFRTVDGIGNAALDTVSKTRSKKAQTWSIRRV